MWVNAAPASTGCEIDLHQGAATRTTMSQPLEEQTDGDPISRLILAVQQVAEKVDSIEARQNQSAVTEKPLKSAPQCVTEALDKFNEIEVIKPATLNGATGRKRPFPRGGGNGSRVPAAFGYRDPSVAFCLAF
ncbi:hypothetical protein QR680_005111 [Steinernema hermaphroditum]|uniref:Uncharacterized protein n=1 Tax=Steinernema hermaphroditum TaxID=289476 RepID=A0AA39LV37_9BILA|nr:hypothetical protein QR680_005111 [Steinernema hermaphroditum]